MTSVNRAAAKTESQRVASVDIGSNTCLMLVVERHPDGRWKPLADLQQITRISERLDATGELAEEAIRRTEAALANYVLEAKRFGVDTILATGTAPFRRAANGPAVARRLARTLGVPIKIAGGEEEAGLSLLATQLSFPQLERMLVVDIGGASTEFIFAGGRSAVELTSIDIGSVRLSERFVLNDPLTAAERDAIEDEIMQSLACHGIAEKLRSGKQTVVGIAGTVTTLAAMALGMTTYDADRVHGYELSTANIEGLTQLLMTSTLEQRLRLPGLHPGRADVITAGALLLRGIVRAAGVAAVVVSDRGVRWGRLFDVCGSGS